MRLVLPQAALAYSGAEAFERSLPLAFASSEPGHPVAHASVMGL